jgi:hypothetical protein
VRTLPFPFYRNPPRKGGKLNIHTQTMRFIMNDRQINRLMMFRAVSDYLSANSDVISSIPALEKLAAKLKDKVSEIEDAAKKHSTITKGKTDAKLDAQERLIASVKAVSSALRTYAHHGGNFETKSVASVREYQLRTYRDEEQLRHATVILAELDAAASELVAYGITPEVLAEYRATVESFKRAILLRDGSVTERTVTHAGIAALILEAGAMLGEELDQMMQMIRAEHPKVYDGYRAVRVTKSLAVRYRKNGEPVTPSEQEARQDSGSLPSTAPLPEASAETAG